MPRTLWCAAREDCELANLAGEAAQGRPLRRERAMWGWDIAYFRLDQLSMHRESGHGDGDGDGDGEMQYNGERQ